VAETMLFHPSREINCNSAVKRTARPVCHDVNEKIAMPHDEIFAAFGLWDMKIGDRLRWETPAFAGVTN